MSARPAIRSNRAGPAAVLSALLALLLWAGAAAAWAEVPAPARSERLATIRERGTLIVGVKTDYPPFGAMAGVDRSEGFEHDLAADIARRLGVGLTKVGVSASNRLQKLQDGTVDMVLATTGDTADRRRIVTMVEPNYYASGVTLFMPPQENIRNWSEIRGQTVCAIQGSYFNRTMEERYLLDLQLYGNPRDARLALRDGRCIGFLFDNTAIVNDLSKPEWAGYKAPLPVALSTPWAIAIGADERGTEFERLLGDIVADWHRSGFLIERERAWKIPASRFLAEMQQTWQRSDDDGRPFCRRGADGNWIPACRNKVFLTSGDVDGLTKLGMLIHETTGIDLSIVYDSYDRRLFLSGFAMTLFLTLACVLGSLLVGVVGAVAADSRSALVAALARTGRALGRMSPPLLTMYLLLFGVSAVLGFALGAIPVAIGCLSVYTGAGVMTALVEAAAIHRLQHPGFRLRLTNVQVVASLASGSVTAALINVSKATMMASAVAVPELLSAATSIVSERGNAGVVMNALLLTFLLLIFCVVRLLRWVERRILSGERDAPG